MQNDTPDNLTPTPAERARLDSILDDIMNGPPETEPPAVDHFDTLAH